ncbi:unnamed protein product [Lymnaea stagnalis]|uniref:Amidase domain-containing protein n=1 Tax=Lymnaea stagnalis TaxID=6523 RepID=A0AAV2HBG4_LYMST
MMADRGVRLRKMLKNDELALPLRLLLKLGTLPVWLVKALAFIASFKDPFGASILGCSVGFDSIPDFFDHVTLFQNWQEEFMEAWLGKRLDAVICPVFPSPAPTRDVIHQVTPCGLYCQLYNSLNYPAGVIPVTTVNKEDLRKTFDENFFTANSMIHKLLLKACQIFSEGISVGVQCVALPFQEEMCLRVMRDLNKSLQEHRDYIG